MSSQHSAKQTNNGAYTMALTQLTKNDHVSKKKEILDILNKSQQVFIYNNVLDYYFKASKTELIQVFKKRYASHIHTATLDVKQTDGTLDFYYMNEFLDEFKDKCGSPNDDKQLFFN
jgi:hypothetical protein